MCRQQDTFIQFLTSLGLTAKIVTTSETVVIVCACLAKVKGHAGNIRTPPICITQLFWR